LDAKEQAIRELYEARWRRDWDAVGALLAERSSGARPVRSTSQEIHGSRRSCLAVAALGGGHGGHMSARARGVPERGGSTRQFSFDTASRLRTEAAKAVEEAVTSTQEFEVAIHTGST
jgi:hypothetical protein